LSEFDWFLRFSGLSNYSVFPGSPSSPSPS
jgi:hypothetical protein